jgi:hypothetical protein
MLRIAFIWWCCYLAVAVCSLFLLLSTFVVVDFFCSGSKHDLKRSDPPIIHGASILLGRDWVLP